MPDAVLLIIILMPAVITFILKSNGALTFLTLCGAFTLISLGSAELQELSGQLELRIDGSTLNLILLTIPLLFTLLLTRKAFSKGPKMFLHLITAICAGGLLALIAVPLLNASARADFADSWGWENLQQVQTVVIAIGLVLSLFLIWSQKIKTKKHK
jgi:hypothetical protein